VRDGFEWENGCIDIMPVTLSSMTDKAVLTCYQAVLIDREERMSLTCRRFRFAQPRRS
jgi:hypothetical protein